ncbi:hypothetical protein BS50DRAFT_636147 [Corynespora cassiicola Philippines]|uniref:N-acetyltransferase domain-containing protein n=1 Tax=Corynespora cassiicola Philippines TaxID=1448308 RepID=A0A2T2NIV8_CORCC|nr:hypothetical protein BS50DRAFT_636147 [Corynespora cassiicola Philippines]
MQLRYALPCEAGKLASIAASAFLNDPFDEFVYPSRKTNMDAYRRMYQWDIESNMYHPFCRVIVAEIPIPEACRKEHFETEPKKSIAGYAVWSRETAMKKRKAMRHMKSMGLCDSLPTRPLGERLKQHILNMDIVEKIRSRTNPINDRKRWEEFYSACESQDGMENSEEPDEHWFLCELAVSPEHQRQGVGTALVNWGLNLARREQLPVLLHSTQAGEKVYQKSGFVKYGEWKWGKESCMIWHEMKWEPMNKEVPLQAGMYQQE